MADEKFTEQFLGSLSCQQLRELIAEMSSADSAEFSTRQELLTRLNAELERRTPPRSGAWFDL